MPPPVVVLEDDPTGTQAVAGAEVVFDYSSRTLRNAMRKSNGVHVLLNSRAFSADRAYQIVEDAARHVLAAAPDAHIVLRGDSTLRAHVYEEYSALRDVIAPGSTPPLVLVPALPGAGRVTIEGTQYLQEGDNLTPLHETFYARDPAFSYDSARLKEWAANRSGDYFSADDAIEIELRELRAGGATTVLSAVRASASADAPTVVVIDATTAEDLDAIAAGIKQAWLDGQQFVLRCSPGLVGYLSDTVAHGLLPMPQPENLLVICGSYVQSTSEQLAVLHAIYPQSFIEIDVIALSEAGWQHEVRRVAEDASQLLREERLAVVTTPRVRPAQMRTLAKGEEIAERLAHVVQELSVRPAAVLAKGGITSHVTASVGLKAVRAHVVGPVAEGVVLWEVETREGTEVPYVVFPGNVGDRELLAEIVTGMLGPEPSVP